MVGSHDVEGDVALASRIRRNPGTFARLRSFASNILRFNGVENVCDTRYRITLGGLDTALPARYGRSNAPTLGSGPASDADIRQIFAFFRVALAEFLVTLPCLLVRAARN